jgi:Heterokaryon incompatibility protein (HET)
MEEAPQSDNLHQYEPLKSERKEIRLLNVQQCSQHAPLDDPVRCTIHNDSLLENPLPKYETISYVWGSAPRTARIFVNDIEVTVTGTAEHALKCIRLHSGHLKRELWIDAICIDQTNIAERSQQVSIMGDVYRSSYMNLIYLGDDDGTIGRAYLDFNNLLREIRYETNNFSTFLETVLDEGDWRHSDSTFETKLDVDALISFYSRAWWR